MTSLMPTLQSINSNSSSPTDSKGNADATQNNNNISRNAMAYSPLQLNNNNNNNNNNLNTSATNNGNNSTGMCLSISIDSFQYVCLVSCVEITFPCNDCWKSSFCFHSSFPLATNPEQPIETSIAMIIPQCAKHPYFIPTNFTHSTTKSYLDANQSIMNMVSHNLRLNTTHQQFVKITFFASIFAIANIREPAHTRYRIESWKWKPIATLFVISISDSIAKCAGHQSFRHLQSRHGTQTIRLQFGSNSMLVRSTAAKRWYWKIGHAFVPFAQTWVGES